MPIKISSTKGWVGAPAFDTFVPLLTENANIQDALELFYYGNSQDGIGYDTVNSIYANLLSLQNGTASTQFLISGHVGATAAHGATGAIVGTTNTQTLTNKTITSPTISNPTFTISSAIAGPNLAPVGSIVMWANDTVPVGWLECNGQSTAAYPALATVVGATVPDMQGLVPAGFKNSDNAFGTLKGTGGSKTSTAAHTHSLAAHVHSDDHRHSGGTGLDDADHAHLFSFTETVDSTGDTAGRYDSSSANAQGTQTYATSGRTGGARGDGTHAHGFTTNYKSEQGHGDKTGGPINNATGLTSDTSGASSAGATNGNLQPYITLKFIIKY
jgi:microcystin-dependent protein